MRLPPLFAILLLFLAGCVSAPKGFGETATLTPGVAAVEPVFVATARKRVEDSRIMFGGERASALSFAEVKVSIPQKRDLGNMKFVDGKPDPAKHFTMLSANNYGSEAEFTNALKQALASRPAGQRSVLMFIHGYNVPFAKGVYGAAQLRHDYQVPGVVVHFSWPSASKAALYLYDRDSAELSRNGLAQTIRAVEAAKPETLLVLAHSMGTFVTMEALRTLSLSGHNATIEQMDALVLAAPDIDVDVFQSQLKDMTARPKETLVLVSGKDRALQISSRLRGGAARLGQGFDKEDLLAEGIVVMDLSTLQEKGDKLSHSTFANSEALIRLVRGGLNLQALEAAEKGKPTNLIGETLGATGDLLSSVIYLPAQIAGAR